MKKFLNIALVVALLCGVTTAKAQNDDKDYLYPHNFISVQGGAQATLTHYGIGDLITPQVALSFGRFFNSKVGVRLHMQGWKINGGFLAERFDGLNSESKYGFNGLTGDLDLLMNMSNILNPNRMNDLWNWYLIAGVGVNHTWGYDEFNEIINKMTYYIGPEPCGTKHSTFNGRFGTMFEYNVSDKLALNLELDANYKNDEFNLKRNWDPDWQIQALVGVKVRFGMKKKVVIPEPEPVVYEEPAPAPKPEPKPIVKPEPKPQPKPVVKDEPLNEVFYYNIRLSDPDPDRILNRIVAWHSKYPKKTITISGYADKGTGNPKINQGYAKARAEKVANALYNKGVAREVMVVNSYGDTVQPFEENDRNRCVIVVGE